ncbi:MAG: YifB family Mg chelatase-like AAA ATPase [Pseudomonadota bacterium]
MTLARVLSRAQVGVEAPQVTVEVFLGRGLPRFTMVGLPETAVREARERVRAAITQSGYEFPARPITVNLAPADLPKEGGRFDLAIAVGVLVASRQLPGNALQGIECYGELSLGGTLRPIRGAICVATHAASAKHALIVPVANGEEAAMQRQAEVYAAATLEQVGAHLCGRRPLRACPSPRFAPPDPHGNALDLGDVQGQATARRALEIAAAGGHSLLLVGPPGTGKTMLATRLPGLLPPLTHEEQLQAAVVHSLAGGAVGPQLERPFRAPHHSATAAAVLGGGAVLRPGEISLAHCGVLFLDELPEFRRDVLEGLREPLEAGVVQLARAGGRASFPARFQLVAAMNPCPCGYLGEPRCRCTPAMINRYRQRISGPLLDRIDLQLHMPRQTPAEVGGDTAPSPPSVSALVARRVAAAHSAQRGRSGRLNHALTPAQLGEVVAPDEVGRSLIRAAGERFGLSVRAIHRVLRVARTVADLAGSTEVTAAHLSEALGWRTSLEERWAALPSVHGPGVSSSGVSLSDSS